MEAGKFQSTGQMLSLGKQDSGRSGVQAKSIFTMGCSSNSDFPLDKRFGTVKAWMLELLLVF